jgi:hypothetical protein
MGNQEHPGDEKTVEKRDEASQRTVPRHQGCKQKDETTAGGDDADREASDRRA